MEVGILALGHIASCFKVVKFDIETPCKHKTQLVACSSSKPTVTTYETDRINLRGCTSVNGLKLNLSDREAEIEENHNFRHQ